MNIQELSELIHFYPKQDVYFDNCDLELLSKNTVIIKQSESKKKSLSFKKFLNSIKKKNIKLYEIKRIMTTSDNEVFRSISKNDLKITFDEKDRFHVRLRERVTVKS